MSESAFFSDAPREQASIEAPPSPTQCRESDTPPLQDSRTDFNVVFIHSRLDDYGLPPSVFRVYAHLARRAGSGAAFPSVASIAYTCLIHPQTVRRALRILVAHQLITREERPGTTPIYRLTPAGHWRPPAHIDGDPSESNTPPKRIQATRPKPMQGRPCETEVAEGNPVEGNPPQGNPKKTPTPRAAAEGLPSSLAEALEIARRLGIEEEFARLEFHAKAAEGWRSGYGNPITSWPDHLQARWQIEQRKRAKRARCRPARDESGKSAIAEMRAAIDGRQSSRRYSS